MSASIKPAVDACIKNELKKRGHEIVTIDYSPGSLKGDNYLGVITKAAIQTKTGQNLNWIVKTSSEDASTRKLLHLREVFFREIDVYEKLFPVLQQIQEEAGVEDLFTSNPIFITSSKGIPEVVVMEDMKSRGFFMKDRKVPLEYDFVKIVMEEYGRFHALSFALREKYPELFDAFREEFQEAFFANVDTDMWEKMMIRQQERVLDMLPQGEVHDKFENMKGIMLTEVMERLKPGAAGQYAVFGHGDSWLNNMLFKCEDNSEIPTKLCFLDFQLCRLGSPALDLSYFLFTCSNKALRDAHWDDFLIIYYESLTKTLKSFNLDAEQLFPYEVLIEHVRRFSLYGLMMAINVAQLMVSDADEVPDIEEMSKLIDKDGMDEFLFTSKHDHLYHERIRGVIEDCVAHGII